MWAVNLIQLLSKHDRGFSSMCLARGRGLKLRGGAQSAGAVFFKLIFTTSLEGGLLLLHCHAHVCYLSPHLFSISINRLGERTKIVRATLAIIRRSVLCLNRGGVPHQFCSAPS